MNWDNLTVTANTNVNGIKTPIQNTIVSFVLYDSSSHSYYYLDRTTNENGVAILPAKNSLQQERVQMRVQTESERDTGGCAGRESEITRYSETTLTNETFTASTVSRNDYWYAASEYDGNVFSSESASMSTTAIELSYDMDENGERATMDSTTIKVSVYRNATIVDGAYVSYWIYNSESEITATGIIKGTGWNGGAIIIDRIPTDSVRFKVHAYQIATNDQYYNINTENHTLTANTENAVTINLTNNNGFYFNVGSVSNNDVLFHYIGTDYGVYPINLYFKNENNVQIIGRVVQTSSTINVTNRCNTRYLRLVTDGYNGTIRDNYDSAITSFDLFGYIGGIIGHAKLLMPKKQYEVEVPPVYDSIDYVYEQGHDVVFNLPNTNMDVKFRAWNSEGDPTFYYDKHLTSTSDTSLTITNAEVSCSTVNRNWFYKCLAGKCGGSGGNFAKINLSKHHYQNTSPIFIVSSYPLTETAESYTHTSSTINFLYCCKTQGNSNIVPYEEVRKVFPILREPNVVFRRNEVQDYVRGFAYVYNGGRINKDSNLLALIYGSSTSETTHRGIQTQDNVYFSTFTLSGETKTPPSLSYFYSESVNSLNHSTGTTTQLSQFKGNFIDKLRKGTDYLTKYTEPETIESKYGDNNSHCYVMDRTIYPDIAPVPHYLYFYNKHLGVNNTLPTTVQYNLCTTVRVKLEKVGNPDTINLQFAINDRHWEDYSIEDYIYLQNDSYVRFRAKTTNQTFSKDTNNYYHFVVDDDYKEFYWQKSYADYTHLYTHEKLGYNVVVGGLISSLLDSSTNSNASVGQDCFHELFSQTKITTCEGLGENTIFSHLDLDLDTISHNCYSLMFSGTTLLTCGPSISATTVGNYSMYQMFENSGVKQLYDENLHFITASRCCCERMFFNSKFNSNLTIKATTTYFGCFQQMFESAKNMTSNIIKINQIENFANQSCYRMFAYSTLKIFPLFYDGILSIGNSAFKQAFLGGKLNNINFVVSQNGSVSGEGCSEMFALLSPSDRCNISGLRIKASNLETKCYYQMFLSSVRLNGTFYFGEPTFISESGCTSMFKKAKGGISCTLLNPTGLSNACYSHMFEECEFSDKKAPELPATTLKEECYSYMFKSSNIEEHHNMYIPEFINTQYVPTKYVLNATVLPKKCYYAMYQDSQLKYVSSIITTGLTTAGIQSCGYMFANTPIFIENRKRKITRSDGTDMTFRVREDDSCYVTSHGDNYTHVGEDIYIKSSSITLGVLTGLTVHLRHDYDFYKTGSTTYTLLHGYYRFIDKTSSVFKSEITLTSSYSNLNFSGRTYQFGTHQTQGSYMTDVTKGYFIRAIDDTVFISKENTAYHMTPATFLNYTLTSITVNNVAYYPFVWVPISWNGKDVFDSETKEELYSNYAQLSYQENTNGYILPSWTNTVTLTDIQHNKTLTKTDNYSLNYVSGSEIVNLNATILGEKCYEYMFSGCPNLYFGHNFLFGNLKILRPKCFSHMFDSCINLRTITPYINKFTSLASYCFEYMYANCSYNNFEFKYKENTPDEWIWAYFPSVYFYLMLPGIIYSIADWAGAEMLSAQQITGAIIAGSEGLSLSMLLFGQGIFHDEILGDINIGLNHICNSNEIYTKYSHEQCIVETGYENPKYYTNGLGYLMTSTPYKYKDTRICEYESARFSTYHDIPLWKTYGLYVKDYDERTPYTFNLTPAEGSYKSMFESCYALIDPKITLSYSTSLPSYCYEKMFYRCTNLEKGITIPTTITNVSLKSMSSMFACCGNFNSEINLANKLSPTALGEECYSSMFSMCHSLIEAPELPATSMAINCYKDLFSLADYFVVFYSVPCIIVLENTSNLYFIFELVGTNNIVYFRYFQNNTHLSSDDFGFLIVDAKNSKIESDSVNFTFGVKAKNKKWRAPETVYFMENKNTILNTFENFILNSFNGKWLYDSQKDKWAKINHLEIHVGQDGSPQGFSEFFNNCEDIPNAWREVNSGTSIGMKRIKANISKSDLESGNYTNNWVSGITKNGIISGATITGQYHGPAYQAGRGPSKIPSGWNTYAS